MFATKRVLVLVRIETLSIWMRAVVQPPFHDPATSRHSKYRNSKLPTKGKERFQQIIQFGRVGVAKTQ